MTRLWWVLVVAGCEPVPPRSMDDVVFPPGEVLDSHRAVHVLVDADPDVARDWFLTLIAPGEGVMYEGNAALAAELGVELRLRPDVDALDAVLQTPTARLDLRQPIDADGVAVVRP